MKCLVIAYVHSGEIILNIEGIMSYYGFKIIESNDHFRVFSGQFPGSAGKLAHKFDTELADMEFDIKDSIFIAYSTITDNGYATLSNFVIKRKGNKFLRRKLFR